MDPGHCIPRLYHRRHALSSWISYSYFFLFRVYVGISSRDSSICILFFVFAITHLFLPAILDPLNRLVLCFSRQYMLPFSSVRSKAKKDAFNGYYPPHAKDRNGYWLRTTTSPLLSRLPRRLWAQTSQAAWYHLYKSAASSRWDMISRSP